MKHWLGVVSAAHVRRVVALGIAQIGHGKRGGLARMNAGDWLIYYSPREQLGTGPPLQAFTAIGQILDEEVWQADEGDFTPLRRRISYAEAVDAPIHSLTGTLDLTSTPNWGNQLRRGLLELSRHDFAVIRAAMNVAP